jgi:hypothetical protein
MMGPELLLKSMGINLPDMQAKFVEAQNMLAQTVNHFEERCKQILESNARIEALLTERKQIENGKPNCIGCCDNFTTNN